MILSDEMMMDKLVIAIQVVGSGSLVILMLFTLLFSRISVKRIERELKKEGLELFSNDKIGIKIIWYAEAIFYKDTWLDKRYGWVTDREDVNRLTTKFDRFLGKTVYSASLVFIVFCILCLFSPELSSFS